MNRDGLLRGCLLLYHRPPNEDAATVAYHIEAFGQHSQYPVFMVNTDCGFPSALRKLRFPVVILHYSLFAGDHYHLNQRFLRYLMGPPRCHTIAFFQDEFRYCLKRFAFLDDFDIDVVYTLLDPSQHDAVYGRHASVRDIRTTLTGYVPDKLMAIADRLGMPDDERTVDVGYRARRLPFWMGRGSQEKHEIAERFLERARSLGLALDIETDESSRIYGDAWYRFVANCRGMLGVETGTSVFDLDDSARERAEALELAEPGIGFDELERRVLHEYEARIPYRTVGPRHFEAAAFRVCQILYEGRYNDVLEPNVHYLELKKDWSNFDDVMLRFSDATERKRITDRAYEDLIASRRWSFAAFVHEFDEHLTSHDLDAAMPDDQRRSLQRRLSRGARARQLIAHPRWTLRRVELRARQRTAGAFRWALPGQRGS